MNQPNDTFYVAFELNTRQEPPMHLTIINGGVENTVKAPMQGTDPMAYGAPNLGVPGAGQTSRGSDLEKAAAELQKALQVKGVRDGFTLKPAEDGHYSVAADGHQEALIPASYEVLEFIAKTVARLNKAKQA